VEFCRQFYILSVSDGDSRKYFLRPNITRPLFSPPYTNILKLSGPTISRETPHLDDLLLPLFAVHPALTNHAPVPVKITARNILRPALIRFRTPLPLQLRFLQLTTSGLFRTGSSHLNAEQQINDCMDCAAKFDILSLPLDGYEKERE
jgi:hypothetical protein